MITRPLINPLWWAMTREVFKPPGILTTGGLSLPIIADNNASFTDEGDSTAGWGLTDFTAAASSSVVRFTKTTAAGSGSTASKTMTVPPPTNTDFIMYGKVKASAGNPCVFWLANAGITVTMGIWLNCDNTPALQNGSVRFSSFNGGLVTGEVVATGLDLENDGVEFAFHIDYKYHTATAFFKQVDGSWAFAGRFDSNFVQSLTLIEARTLTTPGVGAWMEFDYLTVCKPNIVIFGDSFAEGRTLYSANPALALEDYNSFWPRHANMYPQLRNNLPVNRGTGGETSAQLFARKSEPSDMGARVVFLHASTNDFANAVPKATRTANINGCIGDFNVSGLQCVLMNSGYGTGVYASNPAHRAYYEDWWNTDGAATAAALRIDIMQALSDGAGYQAVALTQADNLHPNVAGYTAIGAYVAPF